MKLNESRGDPRAIHLQWFGDGGNPAAGAAGAGSGDPGQGESSFLTGSGAGSGQGGQPAGAPSGQGDGGSSAAGAGQTAPGARPAWKAQLPKDLQEDTRFDRFPNLGELGKAYAELEGKIGNMVSIPGDGASAEDWAQFWEKTGRPKTGAEYALEKLKDLPAGLEYTDDSSYRAKAHDLGLSKKQAEGMYQFINTETLGRYSDSLATQKRATAETEATLRKEWGPDFGKNVELMHRAVDHFGGKETSDLFASLGLQNDPRIARLFAGIGKAIGEGTFLEGGGVGPSDGEKHFDYPGLK